MNELSPDTRNRMARATKGALISELPGFGQSVFTRMQKRPNSFEAALVRPRAPHLLDV